MNDANALSPKEAAYIAANVYFTLEGWEATYQYNEAHAGDKAALKNAPKPVAGLASNSVVKRNVTGQGSLSLNKVGIENAELASTFQGSSGSNLLGRTKSGFGYILQFERGGAKHAVVAIRGTRPEMGYPDLLTDANAGFTRKISGYNLSVHAGFYDVYNSISHTLNAAIPSLRAVDYVHVVGHSLGGAIANLVALHLAKFNIFPKLYTFGAPRVGLKVQMYDKLISSVIGEDNIFRVSHNFDPIPMIPVSPYIHVHPHVRDENNFFMKSPKTAPVMVNHGTDKYIETVGDLNWQQLRSASEKEGYLDKQFFNSWRQSENWLKRYVGRSLNEKMGIMQRILQGLIDEVGEFIVGVATVLDLLAMAIEKGIKYVTAARSYLGRFLEDCVRLFSMGADMTIEVLKKLYRRMTCELAATAKLALKLGGSASKSTTFKIILPAATGIGLLLL